MLKTKVKRPYELYNYINKKPSEGTVSIANYFLLNLLPFSPKFTGRINGKRISH